MSPAIVIPMPIITHGASGPIPVWAAIALVIGITLTAVLMALFILATLRDSERLMVAAGVTACVCGLYWFALIIFAILSSAGLA